MQLFVSYIEHSLSSNSLISKGLYTISPIGTAGAPEICPLYRISLRSRVTISRVDCILYMQTTLEGLIAGIANLNFSEGDIFKNGRFFQIFLGGIGGYYAIRKKPFFCLDLTKLTLI